MSTTNFEQNNAPDGPDRFDDVETAGRNKESQHDPPHPENGGFIEAFRLSGCALIARPSEWSVELEQLGVRTFKRPEALYNALRNRTFLPESCIVDLDSIPRNLIKAVDIRIPCPKVWVGKSASNPSDIKNFGVYYSRARADELVAVISRLLETDRSTMLPAGLVARQMLPLLVADDSYCERLRHYSEMFAESGLITIHGGDPLELQLVAQYMAVETGRARIWEIKSEASIHSTLRKIAQARRPGNDVTIVLSTDVDTGSAREFHKSMPAEYSMIKLAARPDNPVGSLSFTLPMPVQRPRDIENWVLWFVCRATINHGIAISGLLELVRCVARMLDKNPAIEDIRALSELSIRQHAAMMAGTGDYQSYEDLVHNYERTLLRQALTRNDWNLSATARYLGLAESSLRYKLKKLGVQKTGYPD